MIVLFNNYNQTITVKKSIYLNFLNLIVIYLLQLKNLIDYYIYTKILLNKIKYNYIYFNY